MNTKHTDTLEQSALQTTIPQFDRDTDNFKTAEKRRQWWAFLDNFLTPLAEKEMVINKPTLKDAPLLSMLATDAARTLRAAATYSEIGSTINAEEYAKAKFRYPQSFKVVQHAARLSTLGKTQAEIIQALQAETASE